MQKILISILLTALVACTSTRVNLSKEKHDEIYSSFIKTKKVFVQDLKQNKKEDIDKFFIKGLRNDYILSALKNVDLSQFFVFIPEGTIDLYSDKDIRTMMIVTIGTTTKYFDVAWVKKNDVWKISSMYEKQK